MCFRQGAREPSRHARAQPGARFVDVWRESLNVRPKAKRPDCLAKVDALDVGPDRGISKATPTRAAHFGPHPMRSMTILRSSSRVRLHGWGCHSVALRGFVLIGRGC